MFKNLKNYFSNLFVPNLGLVLIYILIVLTTLWSSSANAEKNRIVAIDGSLVEIIFALGGGDQLVGRDLTARYPAAANELPSIGYKHTLSTEGILSLRSNIIIATTDSGSLSVLKHLRDAGVRVELIENIYTVEGVKDKIRQVAIIIGKEAEAEALVDELQASFDRAMVTVAQFKQQHGELRAIFISSIRGSNMRVAGRENKANRMLELAGLVNPVAPYFKGYKPLTPEAAIKYNPQVIIVMPHGYKTSGGREAILNLPAISLTEAGIKRQLVVMDSGFLTFGPRLGETIEKLVNAVYREKTY